MASTSAQLRCVSRRLVPSRSGVVVPVTLKSYSYAAGALYKCQYSHACLSET